MIQSLFFSFSFRIFASLTKVPLVLPRSSIKKAPSSMKIRAWWPDTAGLSITRSLSGLRPMVNRGLTSGISLRTCSLNFRKIFGMTLSSLALAHQPIPDTLHGRLAGALLDGDENHGGVVQAASRVGQRDQAFCRRLWILLLPDDFEDLGRLHAARQAVRAQEQLIPLHQWDLIEFDFNGVVDTQGAGDDVLLRR